MQSKTKSIEELIVGTFEVFLTKYKRKKKGCIIPSTYEWNKLPNSWIFPLIPKIIKNVKLQVLKKASQNKTKSKTYQQL